MNLVLGRSFALSLMLHAFALAYVGALLPRAEPLRAALADLSVWLREEPKRAPPPLAEPEPTRRFEPPPAKPRAELRKSKPAPKTAKSKPAPLRLPYPLEAVARGLEGDVMVRVTLDDTGNVVASRLEASSGHPLLDAAAVQAARGLRGLPDTMARDALIPVRFRLK
jgi:protein TonB